MPLTITSPRNCKFRKLPNLTLWLAADQLSLSDNDPVATWTNVTGGSDFTQSTPSFRPTYKTNIVNGHPVVRFSAPENWLGSTTGFLNSSNSKGTVFIVSDYSSLPTDGYLLNTRHDSATLGGWFIFYQDDPSNRVGYGHTAHTPSLTTPITDQFNLIELRRDGLDVEFGTNGTLASPVTLSGYTPQTATITTKIGAHDNPSSTQLNGDIAEILLFESVLTDLQMYQVERCLMDKYGIT